MLMSKIWRIFEVSGSIEAYLYYKEFEKLSNNKTQDSFEVKVDSLIDDKLLQGF